MKLLQTYWSKLLAAFLVCMSVPVLIALISHSFYRSKEGYENVDRIVSSGNAALVRAVNLTQQFLLHDLRSPRFYEDGSSAHLQAHGQQIADIQHGIDLLERSPEAAELGLTKDLDLIRDDLDRYQRKLGELVTQLRERGFQDYGHVGAMRETVHALQETLAEPRYQAHLLMMRRHEKDYIIRDMAKYVDQLHERSELLVEALRGDPRLGPDQRTRLIAAVDDYVAAFDGLVGRDREIGLRSGAATYGDLLSLEQTLEEDLRVLTRRLRDDKSALFRTMETRLFATIGLLTLLALAISVLLARSLTRPLQQLSRQIRDYVDAGFVRDERNRIVNHDSDEVGVLARNLALMQEKMTETVASLTEQKRAADAANQSKSLFLANTSHEIRTPLNGVVGVAQLLSQTELDREQRELAAMVQNSARNLLHIVNEILDFSKIEAGRIELDPRPFDLVEELERSVETYRHEAHARDLVFEVHVDDNVPRRLEGDAGRLMQIVTNLLSNAFKFTTEGAVRLRLRCEGSCDQSLCTLRCSVTDSGIGVSADAREKIFESFNQADASTTRRFGGTGLGLAISRRLAELMGGEIGVDSREGEGSTFWFTVRMNALPASDGTQDRAASEALARLRVLVVEDNPLNQKITLRMLQKLGCETALAENGQEAVTAVESSCYDLILMDVQMPVMDGVDATRLIRAREAQAGGHVPILALTANATVHDRDRCLTAGMQGFLTKPVTLDGLQDAMARVHADSAVA